MTTTQTMRFSGEIAGVGTVAGPRIVVGNWSWSPLGAFADVMLEETDGHRVLLAPDPVVADFVSLTYAFDEVVVGPVVVTAGREQWSIAAPGLELRLGVGARSALGALLRLQPRFLVGSPRWASVLDPIARRIMPGVRTRGSAAGDRQEFYGASDLHRLIGVEGVWRDEPLGALALVDPPVRFGFGSAPTRPALTRIVTTVLESSEDPRTTE